MTLKHALCGGAALVAVAALAAPGAASAQTAAHHHHRAARRHAAAAAPAESSTLREIRELRDQVQALQARLDAQSSQAAATQAQVQTAQAQAAAAQSQAAALQSQVATQIETIPDQVKTQVAKAAPKTDKIYYKGLGITLGGFVEAASIYRDHFIGNDIATSFNSIPLPNNRAGHSDETRFTARQSRLSILAEGNPDPHVHLAMYGEFDFQGAAQTANSNESNSYNPRIRHLYGQVDWSDFNPGMGLHLLAGQTWSLVTMNTKGITPRNELTPPQIDAQYVPGFAWARQPQVRVAGDFLDHKLWLAVSAENPQTTVYTTGGGALPSALTYNVTGGSGFNSANTESLNHLPDVVAKVAYEANLAGHGVHLEAFGLARAFTDRVGSTEDNVYSGGGGVGIVAQAIPSVLDLQVSALAGHGVGRYGSSQLPDVTFSPSGAIKPLTEFMALAGGTFHANKALDIYAFAGEEHVDRNPYFVGNTAYGYGNPLYSNAGCFTEGGSPCTANTKLIDQATLGFWQKLYQGPWGRLQFGAQYSYTERKTFSGVGGAPDANENMLFTSFRYYPF